MLTPKKITAANAGGPRQLPRRTLWAARVAQFWRWAAAHRAMKTLIAYAPVLIGIRVLVVFLMGAPVGIPIV